MGSTWRRSLVKGAVWELLGLLLLFLLSGSLSLSLGYFALRIMMYFVHERVWKKVRWGKI